MKVLMLNGSPRKEGCTFTALSEIVSVLAKEGIESEIFQIGSKPVSGCTACGVCAKGCVGKCTIHDGVNEFLEKAGSADGIILGSPVYFASVAGSVNAFLDRVFYVGSKTVFPFKPGAAIVSCRRGGASAALDRLNKYLTISQMPVVSSRYWNMVHGNTPEEVLKDEEGMQVMRAIGSNMAWLLKNIEAGKNAGIRKPEQEPQIRTNFIKQ